MEIATIKLIREKFHALAATFEERSRRQWAAVEARAYGAGGVTAVSRATGLARDTIRAGLRELAYREEHPEPDERMRRKGAGRKRLTEKDPELLPALEALIEPLACGDQESPLRWTCRSTADLAADLTGKGHPVGDRKVAQLLQEAGYSLQANRKSREGSRHPDLNHQFAYINTRALLFRKHRAPVISIDLKKKQLPGESGREGYSRTPKDAPFHDFLGRELRLAIAHSTHDMVDNLGWTSVGINRDTVRFATESIHRWWLENHLSRAKKLFIVADCSGDGDRAWQVGLQRLASDSNVKLHVSHFPPGTYKWINFVQRSFIFNTLHRRGEPPVSHQITINMIASSRITRNVEVKAVVDEVRHETDIMVNEAQIGRLNLVRAKSHGDWNYKIYPQKATHSP